MNIPTKIPKEIGRWGGLFRRSDGAKTNYWAHFLRTRIQKEEEMSIQQSVLDHIRIVNKYVTNKLLIHIAGKNMGLFAILSHVGRKSGKIYKIPIIVESMNNGFVIALTYGKKTDWYENVKAKGGCSLKWKNKEYRLTDPEFIDKELALQAFPAVFKTGLRIMGIQYYLRLSNELSSQP